MNTPTHLAAGVVIVQAVLATRLPGAVAVATCLVAGALSHLALDAVPHYNWIVYLDWFQGVPFHWLIRQAVFSVPILALAVWLGRGHWWLTGLALVGCIYPDLEKVLYVDFHIPQWLVLFRGHSLSLSGYTGGWPRPVLVGVELLIMAGMVAGAILLARSRKQFR